MIKTNKGILRTLSMLLLAALILASLPTAALADSFSAAVKSKNMKVYADSKGKEYIGSLPKKTIVVVKEYKNGVAKISYNGVTGYAKVSDMQTVESIAEEATVNTKTRVYEEPDTDSRSVSVKAGMKVYVLATKGGIAMVEKGGHVGYMNEKHLTYKMETMPVVKPETSTGSADKSEETSQDTVSGSEIIDQLPDSVVDVLPDSVVDTVEKGEYTSSQLEDLKEALEAEYKKQQEEAEKQEEEAKQPTSESIESAFASGKYSNEQLCYAFLTKVMGYNTAAAAGVLSNISAESGFRVNANGDSGKSYGICQWYSARKTRLLNWCESKGKDPAQLLSQLYFLKYELETYYPAVNRYMKSVENSEQGAFDAAYYFCYHFEAPANRASKSTSRGNNAKNIFYPRYASV